VENRYKPIGVPALPNTFLVIMVTAWLHSLMRILLGAFDHDVLSLLIFIF